MKTKLEIPTNYDETVKKMAEEYIKYMRKRRSKK